MDDSETIAHDFLLASEYGDIRYEPDGNVPPDFLVEGRIAVEVRRLNQAHDDGAGPRGLEEVERPLTASMRNLLRSFGPPTNGRSWFVTYSFARPVPPVGELRKRVRAALAPLIRRDDFQRLDFDLGDGLRLMVLPASRAHEDLFLLGGWSDQEAGGWLLAELEDNLNRCIEEKSRKIAGYRSRYTTWWLLLVDHIGYGLDEEDREMFSDPVRVPHGFSRIVLIDPRDPRRAFDVSGVARDSPIGVLASGPPDSDTA